MKVFISQPMNGKTDEQIKEERNRAIRELKRRYTEPIAVIDSFFEKCPHDVTPLWFLGESIKLLGEAHLVCFCRDWEQYRGCTIEHECAVKYGKKCEYV